MSKTKKITSIAFAIIFAFLTCGIGLLTFLPSYFNGKLAEDKQQRLRSILQGRLKTLDLRQKFTTEKLFT